MASKASDVGPSSPHLDLVGRVDGFDDAVNGAVHVPKEDGVISISDDRTIRVWMKRYTGKYWPTICHNVPAAAVSLDFKPGNRHLAVGLDNGTVMEFQISDDYNKLTHVRDYLAHQGRVTGVQLIESNRWLLSCGSTDKCFMCFSTESGQRLSGYQLSAPCTCLIFDEVSNYAYIGDATGQLTVAKVNSSSMEKITVIKKHTGAVNCLAFDPERRVLFSGSSDQSVIMWDVKNADFPTLELHGHDDHVRSIVFCPTSNRLLTAGDDSMIVCWSLDAKRDPPVKWHESDECEKCSTPFFWNVKLMWEAKTIGGRQHHCRNCGKALCAKCAANTLTIPNVGHECLVKVCDDCRLKLDDEQQASLATFHDAHHVVTAMHLDETKKLLLTVGKDRLIKLWDASSVLQ